MRKRLRKLIIFFLLIVLLVLSFIKSDIYQTSKMKVATPELSEQALIVKESLENNLIEEIIDEDNTQYDTIQNGNGTIKILEYHGNGNSIVIPDKINDSVVKEIDENAFAENSNLEMIKITTNIDNSSVNIKNFEYSEALSDSEYNVYVTTRQYSPDYIKYINLTDEEKKNWEVIPPKFITTFEETYRGASALSIDEAALPTSYDLRSKLKSATASNLSKKNQARYGICYAYATTSALETYVDLKKGKTEEFSETELAVMTNHGYGGYFPYGSDKGDWDGPVIERAGTILDRDYCATNYTTDTIASYINNFLQENSTVTTEQIAQAKNKFKSLNPTPTYYLQGAKDFTYFDGNMKRSGSYTAQIIQNRNAIKEHVQEYGSVYTYIAGPVEGINLRTSGIPVFYSADDRSEGVGRHAVSIIGWDDNFPKENFPSSWGVTENGAYLVLNSWGQYWGNNGTFWISYQDFFVETYNSGVTLLTEGQVDINKATITLSQTSYTYDGTAKTPAVTVTYNGKTYTRGTDYTVSYVNNTSVGTATVYITGMGSLTGTATRTFTIVASAVNINSANITLSPTSYTYDGKAKKPTVTVKYNGTTYANGTDYTVTYINNTSVGTGTVSISGTGRLTGTATRTFEIEASAVNIGSASITINPTSYYYDGTRKTPEVLVRHNGIAYIEGSDYVVTYSNNINAGTATVNIYGAGRLTGSTTRNFTIRSIPLSSATITIDPSEYVYDGTAKKPAVTVEYNGVTYRKGTDYTVDYSNNTAAGSGRVTITGTGNMTGTVNKSFTIAKANIADATITLSQKEYYYDGTAKKPTVTAKYKSMTLTEGTDFRVTYGNNTNVGTATVVISGRGNYTDETTKEFTIKTDLDVSKMTITINPTSYVYDGTEKQPTVTVKDSKKTYTKGTDYTVEYSDNVNIGTAKVKITGIRNLTGVANREFEIVSIDISKAQVTLGTTQYTYDGTAKTPDITVKYSSKTLTKDTDYTVSYVNNTNVGMATAQIVGKNIYSGTAERTFKIVERSISEANVDIDDSGLVYDGTEKIPKVAVSYNSTELETPKDYSLTYTNNIKAGTAYVNITGAGNFKGTLNLPYTIQKEKMEVPAESIECVYDGLAHAFEIKNVPEGAVIKYGTVEGSYTTTAFPKCINVGEYTIYYQVTENNHDPYTGSAKVTITPADISKTNIEINDSTCVYTGTEKKPQVTVTFNDKKLSSSRDYELTYSDNINAGSGKANIKGTGNFGGETVKNFTIQKASPKYKVPTGLVATYGKTLADVELPEGFYWEEDPSTPVGDVGNNVFHCTFKPEDSINYEEIKGIEITIQVTERLSVEIKGYVPKQEDTLPDVIITEVPTNTKLSELKTHIETNGKIECFNPDNTKASDSTMVKTGMKIKITKDSESVEYILAVTGDLNGDGKMDGIDLLRLARYLEEIDTNITAEYLWAGNLYKDETINMYDLLRLARVLSGIETL